MQKERYQLSVCPHDTAKHMVEWFYFNTYLQRKLDCGIHFEPQDNFNAEREAVLKGRYNIVYANPFSACAFIQELGYMPVAKGVGLYDETLVVTRAGEEIPSDRPLKVASASDKLIVHTLGISVLEQLGIHREECEFKFMGNHMKAAHAVLKREADVGFIFNETWHGMVDNTRNEFKVAAESTDGIAFHCFLIAPEWAHRRDDIQQLLVHINEDPKGKDILDSLDFTQGLELLSEDAMDTLQVLLVSYNTLHTL
jgi:phosphonate transport system substrate-binding protein